MNKAREKKQQIVEEISEKVKKAKTMVFANYQGMTHKQLENLKKELKKVEAELVVTKNTLLNRALTSVGYKLKDSALQNPTATLFAYADIVLPLKALAKTIKTLQLPKIKSGIMGTVMLTETEILRLSTLPPRETLLTQIAWGMKSPLFGLHRALNWNIEKLALTLKSIELKK